MTMKSKFSTWGALIYMKSINLQDMPHEESKVPDNEGVYSDKTSLNAGHRHVYFVDESGNGEALMAYSPKNPFIKHKHKIINWVVQTAKSKCYPVCEDSYGAKGVPNHAHLISVDSAIEIDSFGDDSKTSSIYNGRAKYKKLVNDGNQPIGLKNIDDTASLVNHLDLWYKEPFYGKYDYDLRLMKFSEKPSKTGGISGLQEIYIDSGRTETDFRLIDFAALAAENFLYQYNDQRDTHPDSILNDIRIVKAYESPQDYSSYFFNSEDQAGVYADFFYDYLQNLKDTKKIKDIYDFLDLFYVWAASSKTVVTETGFCESQNYMIYNTGLAFDYMEITSEQQKQQILNDPRFPTLNYVAKINGLRIDPNYPARLIADINSKPILEFAATKFKTLIDEGIPIEDRPAEIYRQYFEPINFTKSSQKKIVIFLTQIATVYRRFIKKYPTYSAYASDTSQQKYKKKFKTSKVERSGRSLEAFFNGLDKDVVVLSKRAIKYYVKFRALETNNNLTKRQLDNLANNMYTLNTSAIKLVEADLPDLSNLLAVTKKVRELQILANEIGKDPVEYAALYGISVNDAENIFETISEELAEKDDKSESLIEQKKSLEKKILESSAFEVALSASSQAINYLESYLKPLPIRNKKTPKSKKGFISSWQRGAGIVLTDILDYYILEPIVVPSEAFAELPPLAQKLLKKAKEDMAKYK